MSTILQFLFKATLFIAFFWVTDAGQTIGVTTCFIVCHAEAPSCASKSGKSTRMLGSLIALDVEVDDWSLEETFRFSSYSRRTWDKIIQFLSFWWSCMSCKQRLCKVCREQPTGNRIGLPSVKNLVFMLKWKFKRTSNATKVDCYNFKLPATKLQISCGNKNVLN